MELEDIVDKYRGAKMNVRLLIAVVVGLLPALYYWTDEGERIQYDLDSAVSRKGSAESKFENGKRKVAQLPALLSKLSDIEGQLGKAKRILPDEVEMDTILASVGTLEKEFNIQITRFQPGQEVQPNPQIEYKEVPVTLEVRGRFPQIMQFYDSLVHLPNLTHLRNISLENVEGDADGEGASRMVVGRSKLILFKGM
ncbi:type 4a pilus biogenesis protein PilO [Pseudobacteriovorax antillogorgiicola]|uniref:Tfp pilus assembly protein PilO n=1 Tax=Pseudobacteriovorax antillogorgiicola TaxID=1513793 RepID=A0A1Y6B5E5_9BACT|nr:type 4a pilus biogenesis protein PilO [Pseudobacteriovorax antillogorgiicola]TCS58915.1 Tfp pilus assembly protein PilO [Pseudobacteriovorax antillogorgiicola]SME93247.1 Tfp pilus assembly protein PilO [Pseudobacteriovorax antillogorgiicola]